jgi:hypothetical protein
MAKKNPDYAKVESPEDYQRAKLHSKIGALEQQLFLNRYLPSAERQAHASVLHRRIDDLRQDLAELKNNHQHRVQNVDTPDGKGK